MSFTKKWAKNEEPSNYEKMVEVIRPSDPLKEKLVSSVKRIELENQRLDQAYARFQKRERELFDKVTEAYKAHDKNRANIYANEVAEIRRIERMILQSKLALEQIALRMRTSTELGDVAASLLPVVDVMNELRPSLASITPQTEKELGSLGDLLSGMVINGGFVDMEPITFESVGEDTSKILGEAQVVAESRISRDFPQLPGRRSSQSLGDDARP
jgi:division protein CdvB (Snf7/Vps24/ESCRT-III family)